MPKHVAALAGPSISRIGRSATGRRDRNVGVQLRASRNRSLPVWQGCRVKGDVLPMIPRSADSLDGRYFGPLPADSIVGRAIVLWANQTEREE
jgi:type IV secretory pathway protease TraF